MGPLIINSTPGNRSAQYSTIMEEKVIAQYPGDVIDVDFRIVQSKEGTEKEIVLQVNHVYAGDKNVYTFIASFNEIKIDFSGIHNATFNDLQSMLTEIFSNKANALRKILNKSWCVFNIDHTFEYDSIEGIILDPNKEYVIDKINIIEIAK